ncbi:MAG: hypothetical protein KC800_22535, partial [Candidatus Eremiobacteraeota bacterium]|nr:hypothetical protein [Candidatus Eremiobacteraeota bacterium]
MRDKRGIALALTLLVLSVMTIVSIAFFQAYHSHFSITRASRDSETAFSACEAAYDYVAYRLEHDRDWGTVDFGDDDLAKDPASTLIVIQSVSGGHEFVGSIPATGAAIRGTIYNNLAGVSAEGGLVPPAGTARCQLECKSGDATRRVEFLVRVAPLFDSSALTRANLNVDAQSLTLSSSDTNRNMLRAEKDIYVPDMLTNNSTRFLLPGTDTPDFNGLMWAKGDIYSYDGGGSPVKLEDPNDFLQASTSSNGKLVSGAESHFSVFEMDTDLIKIPDSHTEIPFNDPTEATTKSMHGRFVFTRREATVTFNAPYYVADDLETENVPYTRSGVFVDVLEYYEPNAAGEYADVPTKVFRGKERTADLVPLIPGEITEDDGFWDDEDTGVLQVDNITTSSVVINIPGYSGGVNILDNSKLEFGNPAGANMTFNLETQAVTATHDAVVDVAGPLEIISKETDGGVVPPPTINLGYESSGLIEGGVSKAVIRA